MLHGGIKDRVLVFLVMRVGGGARNCTYTTNSSHMCFLGDYKDVMHSMLKEDIFIFALGLAYYVGVLPDDIKIGDLQVAQINPAPPYEAMRPNPMYDAIHWNSPSIGT